MLELAICLVIAITDGDTLKVRCGSEGRVLMHLRKSSQMGSVPERSWPRCAKVCKPAYNHAARIVGAAQWLMCNATVRMWLNIWWATVGRGYLTNTRKNTNTCTHYKPALARGIMVCGLTKIAKRRPFRRGDGAETSIKAIACNPFSKHLKPPPLAACISIVFPASAAAR